jgi:hypothetical protein
MLKRYNRKISQEATPINRELASRTEKIKDLVRGQKEPKTLPLSLPFLYRGGEGWLDLVGFGWTGLDLPGLSRTNRRGQTSRTSFAKSATEGRLVGGVEAGNFRADLNRFCIKFFWL